VGQTLAGQLAGPPQELDRPRQEKVGAGAAAGAVRRGRPAACHPSDQGRVVSRVAAAGAGRHHAGRPPPPLAVAFEGCPVTPRGALSLALPRAGALVAVLAEIVGLAPPTPVASMNIPRPSPTTSSSSPRLRRDLLGPVLVQRRTGRYGSPLPLRRPLLARSICRRTAPLDRPGDPRRGARQRSRTICPDDAGRSHSLHDRRGEDYERARRLWTGRPCWVAATPARPRSRGVYGEPARGGFAGGVTWPPSRLLGGT
jgi:hypothetical protein